LSFAGAYVNGWDELTKIVEEVVQKYGQNGFTEEKTKSQFEFFAQTLASIESFLMSNWDANGGEIDDADIIHLAEETLAYFLSDDEKKQTIRDLFKLLAENISRSITEPEHRKIYGRTLYGLRDAQEVEGWVQANIGHLRSAGSDDDKPPALQKVARGWIQGRPFHELFGTLKKGKAKLFWGTRRRDFKIDHVVEICEGGLSYDGALLVGALTEFIELVDREEAYELITRVRSFQKHLKYGLPTEAAIALYELGFSDRAIALDLASSLDLTTEQKNDAIKALKRNKAQVLSIVEKYPSYFQVRLNEIVSAKGRNQ